MFTMKKYSRRRGTTLLEVVLVVAIIVIISGVGVVSLGSMYAPYKLNGAIDSVRSAWADARARAIEEGRPYRFAVEPSGSSFRVAPDQPEYWEGNDGPSDDPSGKGLILEQSLPSGVRFTVNGDGSAPSGDEPAPDVVTEKPVTNTNWETTIIFLPDGTAREDVRVTFHVRGARTTSIQLRGLTGNVSVHPE